MENERGRQEVLMALQGVGRLGIMMDPVFKPVSYTHLAFGRKETTNGGTTAGSFGGDQRGTEPAEL